MFTAHKESPRKKIIVLTLELNKEQHASCSVSQKIINHELPFMREILLLNKTNTSISELMEKMEDGEVPWF
jgi:hypothetical protein